MATQQITVKTLGTNTTPTANAASARTLTAKPVDIRLTAHDLDELDAASIRSGSHRVAAG